MAEDGKGGRRRLLDPVNRISELVFGLIIALTFTTSLSAATSGREEVRTMLLAALSCNLAWGIVDAVMYLVTIQAERSRGARTLREIRSAPEPEAARLVAAALPEPVAAVMRPQDLEALRSRLGEITLPDARLHLTTSDALGAAAVCLLAFLSTFPVALPFLLMRQTLPALRVSNGVAIVMLFILGRSLARYAGSTPWRTGLALVVLGVVLVGIAMALGG